MNVEYILRGDFSVNNSQSTLRTGLQSLITIQSALKGVSQRSAGHQKRRLFKYLITLVINFHSAIAVVND